VRAIWYWQAKFIFLPSRGFHRRTRTRGTLLYFHGNAANVAANLDHVLHLRSAGLNVFIIDYRGYGSSTGGPPREKLLYEDAERAWKNTTH
jgi:alpha-beta hydrolase superfamily lysophospholipase